MEINIKYNGLIMTFNNSIIENKLLNILSENHIEMIYDPRGLKYLFIVDKETFIKCMNMDKKFEHEFSLFDCDHPYFLLCNMCEKVETCDSKLKFIRGERNE